MLSAVGRVARALLVTYDVQDTTLCFGTKRVSFCCTIGVGYWL